MTDKEHTATLDEIRSERIAKKEALEALGINPYPSTSARTHAIEDVRASFPELEMQATLVTVAGRVTGYTRTWRFRLSRYFRWHRYHSGIFKERYTRGSIRVIHENG